MRTVVAFDFDGTLTTRDTFPAFIRFSLGFWRFAVGLALFAPMLVAMKGGFYPNWKAKQRVFSHFLKGCLSDASTHIVRIFAETGYPECSENSCCRP